MRPILAARTTPWTLLTYCQRAPAVYGAGLSWRHRDDSCLFRNGGTVRRGRKPVSLWHAGHTAAVCPALRAEKLPVMRREGRGFVIAVAQS